jgi:parallel beta-helix repeat protein
MEVISMKVSSWLSGLLCVVILTSLFPVQPAKAAPRAPTLVIFWVNSNADNDEYDSYLTLREAMLAANGSFTRSYSVAERAQMTGCTFDVSGNVIGGCGLGDDYILFTAAVTQINLLSSLPDIIKDGVSILGTAGTPVIDLKAGIDSGFMVQANNVYLGHLTIINNVGIGAAITTRSSGYKGLKVVGNYLGVTPTAASCSDPAITSRPFLVLSIDPGPGTAAPGDGTAYIYENVIGCSQNDGISINTASYVYIGQDSSGSVRPNFIGVTRSGANIGNLGHGIILCCSIGPRGNVIIGNQIGYNTWSGIWLEVVSETTVSNNEVHHNARAGIWVRGSSRNTLTNNLSHHNVGSGILLDQFAPSPPLVTFYNTIIGGASYHNNAAGITEGGGADYNTWSKVSTYGNVGLGIDKGDIGAVNAPPLAVTGITPAAQGVLVNGTFTVSSSVLTTYRIELYRAARDSTGYGEGKIYIGSVDLPKGAAGTYNWSIPDPLGAVCYTATLTVSDPINLLIASSSEFSANLGVQCNQTFIPAVFR